MMTVSLRCLEVKERSAESGDRETQASGLYLAAVELPVSNQSINETQIEVNP